MKKFNFFLLAVGVVSVVALAPFSFARDPSPSSALTQQKAVLQGLQNVLGKRILFVDVDHTLGVQNNDTQDWVLYDGALEFLRDQYADFSIVLFTANSRQNVLKFFRQYPHICQYVAATITGESFAPHFARLIEHVNFRRQNSKGLPPKNWRQWVYEVWKENPAHYMPEGTTLASFPSHFSDWEAQVYIPFILPDKSSIVAEFNGLLVDDRFAGTERDPQYRILQEGHRGIYVGPVGGVAANAGPHFSDIAIETRKAHQILSEDKRYECSKALRPK